MSVANAEIGLKLKNQRIKQEEVVMEIEIGKYYDVTELSKKVYAEYNVFEKVLFCVDKFRYWIARIQVGINENYETQKDAVILEREDIDRDPNEKEIFWQQIALILKNATFDNYDIHQYSSVDDALSMLPSDEKIKKLTADSSSPSKR